MASAVAITSDVKEFTKICGVNINLAEALAAWLAKFIDSAIQVMRSATEIGISGAANGEDRAEAE